MQAVRLLLTLALLGSGACGAQVEGELFIDPGSYRTLEYAPDECADGDHFGFFGVQLRDSDDRILEFFRNGGEPGMAFYAPGEAAFELGPADCTTFVGSLDREHNETTDEGRVAGSFELDCEAPNGWLLAGRLSFERCADPESEDDDDDCDEDDDDVWPYGR